MASYDFTYPLVIAGIIVADLDGRVQYRATPGRPARIRFDEYDHPAEDPEIDIDAIELHGHPSTWAKAEYRLLPPSDPLHGKIETWLKAERFSEMCEAADDDGDRADYEYDRRRDERDNLYHGI
jgi:hypothetical protein